MAAIFEKFPKSGFSTVHCLDTLGVENFEEITLSSIVLGINSIKKDRLITSQNGWSLMKNRVPFPGNVYSDIYFHPTFSTHQFALPVRHKQSW